MFKWENKTYTYLSIFASIKIKIENLSTMKDQTDAFRRVYLYQPHLHLKTDVCLVADLSY